MEDYGRLVHLPAAMRHLGAAGVGNIWRSDYAYCCIMVCSRGSAEFAARAWLGSEKVAGLLWRTDVSARGRPNSCVPRGGAVFTTSIFGRSAICRCVVAAGAIGRSGSGHFGGGAPVRLAFDVADDQCRRDRQL